LVHSWFACDNQLSQKREDISSTALIGLLSLLLFTIDGSFCNEFHYELKISHVVAMAKLK
jgi:hypothetical protein